MTGTPDAEPNFLARIAEEIAWLKDHPEFDERPASIKQFLGPGYLDIRSMVRDRLVPELVEIFGEEPNPYRIARYQKAIFTGGIGTGKSTMASIALCYMVHWLLCLKNPQKFFNLLPGSRIAVMMMSTSGAQARGVIFGDIKARVDNSDWFKKYPYDKKFVNQIRFKKVVDGNEEPVWIIPGDSAETSFEGFNILCGILDEIDSHKVTKEKDYAEQGYCVDAKTEILTDSGWKRYDDLKVGESILTLNHETGFSEWQPVQEVCVFPSKRRKMMLIENPRFSSLSTLDHRWPVVASNGERYWRTTETLTTTDKVVLAALPSDLPTEATIPDSLVELVAWLYTEGHIHHQRQGNVTIYQRPGVNADRIRSCLSSVFGEPVESFRTYQDPDSPTKMCNACCTLKDKSEFHLNRRATDGKQSRCKPCLLSGAKSTWKRKSTDAVTWRENLNRKLLEFHLTPVASKMLLAHAPDKVPSYEFLNALTKDQLELFIQVSLLADNCGEDKLAQKNPRHAEQFAYACIRAGHAVSIRPGRDHRPRLDYQMTLARRLRKSEVPVLATVAKDAKCETKVVQGVIWCPRVKNKTWLARRNGSVYFTGNTTISNRVTSRFEDRGFVFCVGQMKSEQGFANRHYKEYLRDPTAYAVKLTIWESKGWHNYLLPDGSRNSFYYDMARKKILSKEMGEALGGASDTLLEVPQLYRVEFESDPVKALRDLAGIPPTTLDAFISQIYRVDESIERWKEGAVTRWATEDCTSEGAQLPEWFRAPDQVPRYVHIDVGITGDALGLVMGHSPGALQVDDELKPRIFIDLAMRITAPPGGEIDLNTVRHILYHLRDDLKFKIKMVTQDSYQSTDMQQQLQKRRFKTDILSMDREVIPYYDLREAINEGRVDMPAVMARMRPDEEPINILRKELATLRDLGTKIDHPLDGSKDVADALAGVVHNIMRFTKVHKNTGVAPSTMDRTTPVLSQGATVPTGPAIRLPGVRKPTKWRPPSRGR